MAHDATAKTAPSKVVIYEPAFEYKLVQMLEHVHPKYPTAQLTIRSTIDTIYLTIALMSVLSKFRNQSVAASRSTPTAACSASKWSNSKV